jgi:hypothetical protein
VPWIGLDDKLGAEVVKSRGLERELGEVKDSLLKESDEHDALRVAIPLVYDDLELAPKQEMSSLVVHAVRITGQAREITRHVLHFDVHRSFAMAHSQYENIDLTTMSQGFMPGYT